MTSIILALLSLVKNKGNDFVLKYKVFDLIIWSMCIKSFLLVTGLILVFIGITVNPLQYILAAFIGTLLLFMFINSDDKVKFITNLVIKMSILLLFYLTLNCVLSCAFDVENKLLLCNFLIYYELEYNINTNLGISDHLKQALNSVFASLDTELGYGNNNNGPGDLFVLYNPDNSDLDLDAELYTASYLEIDEITSKYPSNAEGFYSKSFGPLTDKYFEQLSLQNFLQEYNNHLSSSDNFTIAKVNQLRNICSSNFPERMKGGLPDGLNIGNDNLINYNDMLRMYKVYTWEDYVLTKAKFFCENKDSIQSSYVGSKVYKDYESCYNYGLNRQLNNSSVFGQMSMGGICTDFSQVSTYYSEICRDALGVKLHLILFNSFFNSFSPEAKLYHLFLYGKDLEDVPYELKVQKYNIYMAYLFKLHTIQYKLAHYYGNILSDLTYHNGSPAQVDWIFKYSSPWDYCKPSELDLDSSTWSNMGLKLSKDFAYSNFNIKSFFKFEGVTSSSTNSSDMFGVGLNLSNNFAHNKFNIDTLFSKLKP